MHIPFLGLTSSLRSLGALVYVALKSTGTEQSLVQGTISQQSNRYHSATVTEQLRGRPLTAERMPKDFCV